jgi:hypothetical protein
MDTLQINNLLNKVVALKKQYDTIAELTGENFNVFDILGMSTREVRTHSAFIAMLLNPEGSHGQKDVFLKLFLQQIGLTDFSTINAKVIVEKHIGYISEDGKEGGNIDILITNFQNQAIIIENKIYAVDQMYQLERYYNYGTDTFDKHYLYYLTLDNTKLISPESKGKLTEEHFINIYYQDSILMWLEECLKEVSKFPIIRETIIQYINLIKILTNQTTYKAMENAINKLLMDNPDFMEVVPIINSELNIIKKELIDKIKNTLNAELQQYNPILKLNDFNFNIEITSDNDGFAFCFFGYEEKVKKHFDTIDDPFFNKKRLELGKVFQNNQQPICWKKFTNYPDTLESLPTHELFKISGSEIIKVLLIEIENYKNDFINIMVNP